MTIRNIGKFLIKSIAFSLIFLFFASILFYAGSSSTTTQSAQYEELLKRSGKQQETAIKQQEQVQIQLDRMDKILDLEEANAKRQTAVIEAWEK